MDILAEINRVMELESRALGRLRETVGPAYEKAVLLIYSCPGKVILTGMGKSGIIAQKIASTMVSTGTPAMFLHPAEGAHGEDRKSTRLNSSHLVISYAVFCLKKKNKALSELYS